MLVIDYYVCPQSSAFIINESKKLFGDIELSVGELVLNSQKVTVDTDYRAENIKEVANEKQKQAIMEIENFAKLVEENSN